MNSSITHRDHFYNSKISNLNEIYKSHKELDNLIFVYKSKSMKKMNAKDLNSATRSLEMSKTKHMDSLLEFNSKKSNKILYKKINEKTLEIAKIAQNRKRMIRENFLLFKEKIKEENQQKKRLVEIKKEIFKHSIQNYQENKLISIRNDREMIIQKDIEKLKKKEKELDFWKNELLKKNL